MLGYLFFLITKERYGGSIYRTKLILKILQYAEDIPISTRELGNIINLDNKTILNVFRKFQKVGLAQKRGNIGWVVTKEGRSIFINVEIDKPSLQYIIRIIKTNYYFKSFNYWRSILQSNIGSCIVPKILYYHWYDEENSKYRSFGYKTSDQQSSRQYRMRLFYRGNPVPQFLWNSYRKI